MTRVRLSEIRYKNQGQCSHCRDKPMIWSLSVSQAWAISLKWGVTVRPSLIASSWKYRRSVQFPQHGARREETPPWKWDTCGSWQCRCVQAETMTDPEPRQAGCTDLRAHLLRTAGRKSGVNFQSLKDSLKARWGISINLQIYPKFSKFTMTNVTVHLNWSSSLGSCGGLEKMPATRTWKEINL